MKLPFENKRYIVALFLTIFITFFGQNLAHGIDVADRTPQVRDAIVAAAGVNSAAEVTAAHLAAITTLNMREKNIATLKAGDFQGLTALSDLNLYNNRLRRLPDGLFEGLPALTTLRLGSNAVDPLPIPVALEKVVEGQFKAVAPTGAPFDYVLSMTATNGSIIGGRVRIPHGRVESEPVTVSRTPGTTGEVTVAIQTLPRLPSEHYGYALVRSDPLPLSVITGNNTAPVFIEGSSATRSVAENTAPGTDIGAAITARDAENDPLTYTLSGADASAFDIDSATGQLKTKASLDYETQNAWTVSINASDGSFTNTITVSINVTDIDEVVTRNTPPSFYEGESATRVVFENTAAGLNIGAPVLATDVPGDFLTYTLGGIHADSFDIDSATGQLKTKAPLDYETQRLYSVRITVDDKELSDTIRVIIGVMDVNDTVISAGFVPVIDRTPEVRDAIVAVVANATDAASVTAAEVARIRTLNLRNRGISSLKTGDFSGMTALRNLNLYDNRLDGLPTGIFTGLPSLTQLRLGGNHIDPLPLIVSLQSVGRGAFKAVMPTGAPFTIVLPIGVTTGSIRGGATSVMIPQGSMESEVFTAVGTGTDTPTVVFRGFPRLPMGHYGYTLAQSTACNRTEQVATAIAEAVGVEDCSSVSEIDLATLTSLNLSNAAITALKARDFAGMLSLTTLYLDGNNLTRLPSGIFSDLPSLRHLYLQRNDLRSLSVDVFEGLSVLETLNLQENALTDLPGRLFDGTPYLRHLLLSHNHLTSLPAGIFHGLTQLHQLHLSWNPNAASQLPLDIALEKVGTHRFKAVVPSGAPFEIMLPITVANGTSGAGAPALMIPKGSVESLPMMLTRTPNTIDAVTVVIETPLPMLPATHNGYVLVKSAIEPLEVIEQINVPPVFTEGADTHRTIAENVATGSNLGPPVPATDANKGAILTYSLDDSADAEAFDINSETGQLKTKAALDFETKKRYAFTITVSDGELSDMIAVTITVSDVNEAPVFATDSLTTQTVAENTPPGENIGPPYSATDADADTLTYSLDDSADAFDIDSETGQLKTKAALDFETKKTYAFTITASDGTLTGALAITINISDVNEVPVFATDSLTTQTVAENTPPGENIGPPYSATDVDGDVLTYSLDDGADVFDIDSETGQLKTKAPLDFETKKTYAVTLTVSDGEATGTLAVRINISDINEVPVFPTDSLRTQTVAENTPPGENIGPPYSVTDVDGDALTYRLDGTDAEAFDIDSETGQLKTKAPLDFETQKTYAVTLTVSDGEHTDTLTIRIDVTDVDENRAPAFTEGSSTTRSVPENSHWRFNIGNAIGATDPDNDALTYSLSGPDASAFSIVSTSGQLQTNAHLDYERKRSYSVTVSVSDGNGGSDSIIVTINIIDVYEGPINRAPVFTEGTRTTRAVIENTVSGKNIGTPVSATDRDKNDKLTYILSGPDAAAFSIVSTSGQLQTKAPLDYERKNFYWVIVSASDDKGGRNSIAVTINITDDPEIIYTLISDRTPQVQAAIVAAIAGVDFSRDVTATHLRLITVLNLANTGVTSLKFNDFDGLTGLETLDLSHNSLTTLPAGIFDKLTALTTLKLNANAISDVSALQGLTWLTHLYVAGNPISDYAPLRRLLAANPNISIDIDMTNNPPRFSGDNIRSIAENTAPGTNIGTAFSATDADSDPLTYRLGGADAEAFDIDSETGQLKTKAPLNFETRKIYSLTIIVSDGKVTGALAVTINVSDVNEAPVFATDSITTHVVAENTPSGENLGPPYSATDVDEDTLTYRLGGADAALFSIDSATGQLKTKTPLDFENKDSYSVTVTVSDGHLTDSITVTIRITNTNEAPSFTDGSSTRRAIAENTAADQNIGTPVSATDAEGDTLSYSLGGTDAASFSIVSTSGQLKTKASLDYERKRSYSVTITVSDGHLTDSITVTIRVTNVNEAPSFRDGSSTTRAIAENTASDQNIGTPVSARDVDGDTLTYRLGGDDAAAFSIVSTSGQLRTKAPLDYEGKRSYTVTITVSDGKGGRDSITVTINVTDVDDNLSPVFTEGSSATRSVLGSKTAPRDVGDPVSARDADRDPVTYRLSGTDAASFSINSETGQLQTSVSLDYTAQKSHTVTVTASDDRGGRNSITVTITVLKPVTDRPSQVRGRIVDKISGVTDANDVTEAHLRSITELQLDNIGVAVIEPGNLDGLTGLTWLSMTGNSLTSLPAGIFDKLTQLDDLDLYTNNLTALPAGIFDRNTKLIDINLNFNKIAALPAGIFDKNTKLIDINLRSNKLTALPAGIFNKNTQLDSITLGENSLTPLRAGIFDRNTKLTTISLPANKITSLPAGIFDKLTQLEDLNLYKNGLTALPAGIFDRNTKLTNLHLHENDITDMSALQGVTSLTHLDVRINPISSYAPLVTLQTAIVAAGNTIAIDITITGSGVNTPPTFTAGTSTSRSVAENTATNTNIGAVIAATDADSHTLSYFLGGTDAASFSIVSTSGQLKTNAALDYETKTSYTVTVTVYDQNSGGDRITVTINVTDVPGAAPSIETPPVIPDETALLTNYPNPFNPETWIPYQLAEPAEVTLTIYDIRGVVVRELKLGYQAAGFYESRSRAIHWDGRNMLGEKVATGLYFYTLTAGDFTATRKLLIRK